MTKYEIPALAETLPSTVLNPCDTPVEAFEKLKNRLRTSIYLLNHETQVSKEFTCRTLTPKGDDGWTGELAAHQFKLTAKDAYGPGVTYTYRLYRRSQHQQAVQYLCVTDEDGERWSLEEPIRIDRANYVDPADKIATLRAWLRQFQEQVCGIELDDDVIQPHDTVRNIHVTSHAVTIFERLGLLLRADGVKPMPSAKQMFELKFRTPYYRDPTFIRPISKWDSPNLATENGAKAIEWGLPMRACLRTTVADDMDNYTLETAEATFGYALDEGTTMDQLRFFREVQVDGPFINPVGLSL